jgi:hypothetical protein
VSVDEGGWLGILPKYKTAQRCWDPGFEGSVYQRQSASCFRQRKSHGGAGLVREWEHFTRVGESQDVFCLSPH